MCEIAPGPRPADAASRSASCLLALGLSHRTATLTVRERVAVTEGRIVPLLRRLVGAATITEAVALSTCNRTELYLAAIDDVAAESATVGALADQSGVAPTELLDHCYVLRDSHATRHLFAVTAGLDSVLLGEAEIQGQVKRAYEEARLAGATGPLTNRLFGAALAAGKRVRSQTGIDRRAVTLASVAVELAGSKLGDLSRRRVLVLGTGKSGELVAQALASQGVRTVFVGGRRREGAESPAARFGVAIAPDDMPLELERADIVLSSTGSRRPVLTREALEGIMARRPTRQLVLIDIGVPRDVEPAVRELPGVVLFDLDDVERSIARNARERSGHLAAAREVLDGELTRFEAWAGALDVLPTVRELRARAEDIVEGVLAENEGRWDSLSAGDRERVRLLARAVAQRLLHEPTRRLKDRAVGQDVARELFGL